MLESIGLTVRVASDGQDAVEATKKKYPTLFSWIAKCLV